MRGDHLRDGCSWQVSQLLNKLKTGYVLARAGSDLTPSIYAQFIRRGMSKPATFEAIVRVLKEVKAEIDIALKELEQKN